MGTDAFKTSQLESYLSKSPGLAFTAFEYNHELNLARKIAILAWERWNLGLTDMWLQEAISLPSDARRIRRAFAVAPAIASFRGAAITAKWQPESMASFPSVDKYVESMMKVFASRFGSEPVHMDKASVELALRYLDSVPSTSGTMASFRRELVNGISLPIKWLLGLESPGMRSVLFMILMPNPIEVAGNEVLGFPYVFANEDYLDKKRYL